MAGIDHTIIAFKNGRLMRKTVLFSEDGECFSLIPFSYSRDGEIRGYELGKGVPPYAYTRRERIGQLFSRKGTMPLFYSYLDKNVEIIVCQYCEEFNASFYLDGKDSYVLLGGYGHYRNPYTHFYSRGYGDEFELRMATECYEWLCSDVLREAVEALPQYNGESEHHLQRLQLRLGFTDFWSLSDEERRNYKDRRIGVFDPQDELDTEDANRLFPIVP